MKNIVFPKLHAFITVREIKRIIQVRNSQKRLKLLHYKLPSDIFAIDCY